MLIKREAGVADAATSTGQPPARYDRQVRTKLTEERQPIGRPTSILMLEFGAPKAPRRDFFSKNNRAPRGCWWRYVVGPELFFNRVLSTDRHTATTAAAAAAC